MLGCSSWPVIWASSTKRAFLLGVGLVEQVLDGDFAADVAIDRPQHRPHAAPSDFACEEVALPSVCVGRASSRIGLSAASAVGSRVTLPVDAGLAKLLCVPSIWPAAGDGLHYRRAARSTAACRSGRGVAAGELVLDIEFHATVRTGKGDHGSGSMQRGRRFRDIGAGDQ